jgi:hypothetical protein
MDRRAGRTIKFQKCVWPQNNRHFQVIFNLRDLAAFSIRSPMLYPVELQALGWMDF